MDEKFIKKRVELFIHQTMSPKRVERKEVLGFHNGDTSLKI